MLDTLATACSVAFFNFKGQLVCYHFELNFGKYSCRFSQQQHPLMVNVEYFQHSLKALTQSMLRKIVFSPFSQISSILPQFLIISHSMDQRLCNGEFCRYQIWRGLNLILCCNSAYPILFFFMFKESCSYLTLNKFVSIPPLSQLEGVLHMYTDLFIGKVSDYL